MTYETYRYIFIGGAILTAILFVVSVILFIVLKIPDVIGDLSGATARKAIENIRNQNESTGEKTYKSSYVNRERGKLTDKISQSGTLIKNPSGSIWGAMATEKISTQKLLQESANETTVLSAENETTVLGSNETTVLNSGNNQHMAQEIGSAINETVLLSPSMAYSTGVFEIEYEITFIHTEEVIE